MLVPMKQLLERARKEQYAVGAFNINDLEILEAVMRAAEKQRSPVIISTSEGAIAYAGMEYLYAMVKTAADESRIPVVLHLDHGRDMNIIKKAITIGYTSIMIDGSHLPFNENVRITKSVVALARKKGISVEGEIGTIGGAEDAVKSRNILLTDPAAAKEFVRKTGVDALAVAIGTSHGAFKFTGKARLDIKRLKEIQKAVRVPLVLHGASGIPKALVAKARKAGLHIKGAEGVPDSQIRAAIKNGITKVNTDTDLRLAFTTAVRSFMRKDKTTFDPRKILGPARDAMQNIVEQRIRLFGSGGKA